MSRKQGPRASGDAPVRECCPPPTDSGHEPYERQGGGAMSGGADSHASENALA